MSNDVTSIKQKIVENYRYKKVYIISIQRVKSHGVESKVVLLPFPSSGRHEIIQEWQFDPKYMNRRFLHLNGKRRCLDNTKNFYIL